MRKQKFIANIKNMTNAKFKRKKGLNKIDNKFCFLPFFVLKPYINRFCIKNR